MPRTKLIIQNGEDVNTAWTIFGEQVDSAASDIRNNVSTQLAQGEFDALVSLDFNMGLTKLEKHDVWTDVVAGNYSVVPEDIRTLGGGGAGIPDRRANEASWRMLRGCSIKIEELWDTIMIDVGGRVLIVLFGCSSVIAQMANGSVASADCKPGNILQADPKIVQDVGKFSVALQSAVASNKKERVASLVRYSLRVGSPTGSYTIRTKRDFIKKYDTILSAGVKKVLMTQRAECVDIFSQGFMTGDGEIWFDSAGAQGQIKVFSMNPPIPTK